VSLGEGMRGAVLKQLKAFGTDLIWVMPGKGSAAFLSSIGGFQLAEEDVDAIEHIQEIKEICPMAVKTFIFEYQKEKAPALVCAHSAVCNEILRESQAWDLDSGRFYKDGEKGLVIGYSVANDFFDKELKPRRRIYINGAEFMVTGVTASMGLGEMGDSLVSMPLDVYRDFTGDRKSVSNIIVQVKRGADVEKVAERIKAELRKSRHVKEGEEDFSVVTNVQASMVVGNIISIIELVLLGLTAFALVIGGIGVMNTMYTSIYERTRDIGIMKAVGAKDREIMAIFLIESGILGMVGGIIGVVSGLAIAAGVSALSPLVSVYYGYELIMGAVIFSFVVGLIAGYMPARRAAQLDPIEALRHD